jgi:hypothetical protein
MIMDDGTEGRAGPVSLTRARVAASAIRQAARHERALLACLAELDGTDEPTSDLADGTRRRARRHAERALSLTRTAVRVNDDRRSEAFYAALLERHERNALLVERLTTATRSPTLARAS